MKKAVFAIAVLILVSQTVFAASKSISLNLEKGHTYNMNCTADMVITQSLMGQQIKMNSTINTLVSYKVNDIVNNDYLMEVTYKNVSFKVNSAAVKVDFSSDHPDSTNPVGMLIGKMVNRSFYMTITKDGAVKEVKGLDNIIASMVNSMPSLDADIKASVMNQLKQSFGEEALKNNMQMSTAIYPQTKVSVGDKWIRTYDASSSMQAATKTEFTLTEQTDTYNTFQAKGTMQSANKDSFITIGDKSVRYDLSGTVDGTIKTNANTGWIMDAAIKQAVSGSIYIKTGEGKDAEPMMVPMSIVAEIRIN